MKWVRWERTVILLHIANFYSTGSYKSEQEREKVNVSSTYKCFQRDPKNIWEEF
jgi:hypothetical protein